MKFLEPEQYQPLANQLYEELLPKIQRCLPKARVEHIGSSSIEGVLSKGDLDIYVGVEPADFEKAIPLIQSLGFKIKENSLRTESLCPFESSEYALDVGIQLVANRSRFEFFLGFRDRLNRSAMLRAEYNQLKMDASYLEADAYRKIKSEFIEKVLQLP